MGKRSNGNFFRLANLDLDFEIRVPDFAIMYSKHERWILTPMNPDLLGLFFSGGGGGIQKGLKKLFIE